MCGLLQLINFPTRVTCNASTLINHILTNKQNNISQSGVIDIAVSDHSMIYCTRKIPKVKYNKHKELTFCSLKNYPINIYKALERVLFPNYENFDEPDAAYNDFVATFDYVLNAIAPFKNETSCAKKLN